MVNQNNVKHFTMLSNCPKSISKKGPDGLPITVAIRKHEDMAKALRRAEKRYRESAENRRSTIVEARANGATLQEIADAIGVGVPAVSKFLKRAEQKGESGAA